MTCQCEFINYNKSTMLVGRVDHGKTLHVWEHGVYGKSLNLLFNFSVSELKTSVKNQVNFFLKKG